MQVKQIIEAILFSSQKPLSIREIREIFSNAADRSEDETVKNFKKIKDEEIEFELGKLEQEHAALARSYKLVCVAGSWQFVSQQEYSPWLKAMFGEKIRPPRLSAPALETLTIIAYRQPITRAEMEQIRGVSVDGVMGTLMERGLIESAGRAEVVGRPTLYATTPLFLEYFGLRRLEDLPAADELRRIPVEKPPALLTVDPGLATAPPEQLALNPAPVEATAGNQDPSQGQAPSEDSQPPQNQTA
ncbi:MAG: SMC-Scp complex subunit ScpB [Verrucomicrobiota bacterium]|nr:SMC-Scp complex subunit ScpB [Verrucomicrobiota bacterium]